MSTVHLLAKNIDTWNSDVIRNRFLVMNGCLMLLDILFSG
jgi:hypothetical protein